MVTAALWCVALCASVVHAADTTKPHYHQGTLRRYERGGYKKAGIVVDASVEDRIRNGPVVTIKNLPEGVMRSTSVQDVDAPPEVVWKLLLDFDNYPKFIDGIKYIRAGQNMPPHSRCSTAAPLAANASVQLFSARGPPCPVQVVHRLQEAVDCRRCARRLRRLQAARRNVHAAVLPRAFA